MELADATGSTKTELFVLDHPCQALYYSVLV